MKILVIDLTECGLAFSLKCIVAGHTVKLWAPPSKMGRGLIERVDEWKPYIHWADLVFITDNMKLGNVLEPYYQKGYPIFGPNKAAARLELDREFGQEFFKSHGIKTLPFKTFTSYSQAIRYIAKEDKPFVSKPWGGNPDKALSYVPKTPEDLICRLQRWQREGKSGEFLLQEKVEGVEMAVGGWFGPGGWSKWINENWEEKRLMNGGLGPNTGEMGTTLRYTQDSLLFDKVLRPLEGSLYRMDYVGYIDVNCLIDDRGDPWPLEFTCRPGWPHFNISMALHKGDPAEWMLDLLGGHDTLECSEDVCVGVVMALGDYPWDLLPKSQSRGWPIRGLDEVPPGSIALSSAMLGAEPLIKDDEILEDTTIVTSGSYVLVATGTGGTVQAAQDKAYKVCSKIYWPVHKIYRTDIGSRLEGDLSELHSFGFAKRLRYN